ncbi:unnamed protein product [Brassica napus]|uniref:non-specific serine/threonine protein kinase n=1 Tax=Brassica napus TaxID=3708 RepID=A0A816JFT5_BRANA|nr:unnamed protein product [Brassica napus]
MIMSHKIVSHVLFMVTFATNNGDSSNHIIAVELDIHKNDEFGDIDDNHVGININGMRSNISASAGYYDQKGEFISLSLDTLTFFFYKRHKKVLEVLEEWEIECGPHRFAYKEFSKDTNGFKHLLGKGGFGQVFKGTLQGSETKIAVKRVSHGSSQGMREFMAEIATIGRLRHPNLVRLLGYCRYKEELYLVYDFMPNGSLDRYLYAESDQEQLTWDQRFKIIKDVSSALAYLHHGWLQVVVHRDIKPANVLIDDKMNASLGDFGLAKLYDQGSEAQTSRVAGTFGYMAPELMRTGRPTTGTDVYAFGVFMLEVSCGRKLFEPRAEPEEVVLADWTINRWENGDILPDNVLDIVRTEKMGKWYETYGSVLGTDMTTESAGNLTITERLTSVGR